MNDAYGPTVDYVAILMPSNAPVRHIPFEAADDAEALREVRRLAASLGMARFDVHRVRPQSEIDADVAARLPRIALTVPVR